MHDLRVRQVGCPSVESSRDRRYMPVKVRHTLSVLLPYLGGERIRGKRILNQRIKDMTRQEAHQKIDDLFQTLLPAHDMPERTEQIRLSHTMLDAMLDSRIALCDAGTGIGKTYAYLVAGIVFHEYRAASGLPVQPLVISTSSIALQNAILGEYLPFLSKILMEDGQRNELICAVIRKGKSHYVCDQRLQKRLKHANLNRKMCAPPQHCKCCKPFWIWIWRRI